MFFYVLLYAHWSFIRSCMSGIYWVFACPLSGVDPNFIIFWRVMIILLPPMLLLGIAINLWEQEAGLSAIRQTISRTRTIRRNLGLVTK
jgi:ABC-type multidrug transport system permease subunit